MQIIAFSALVLEVGAHYRQACALSLCCVSVWLSISMTKLSCREVLRVAPSPGNILELFGSQIMSVEDDIQWKTNFNGVQPLIEY